MKNKSKFTPPDYLFGYIGLQIILHYFLPINKIIFPPFIYFGIPLIIFGLYLNWVHVYNVFIKAKTHFDVYRMPKVFVTSGFFKYSRNPTYFGMFLTLLGVAVLLGSITTFLLPILFLVLINKFTIPIEEKNLEEKFGKKYLNYKKKVRRWI